MTGENLDCRICHAKLDPDARLRVPEMMFGTREWFTYLPCADCGCLQITRPPDDLSRFYPKEYYSLAPHDRNRGIVGMLRRQRARYRATGMGMLGGLIDRLTRYPYGAALDCVRRTGARYDHRILDVGCGGGALLNELASAGFQNLVGVDRFAASRNADGVRLVRGTVHDVPGQFDLVMLHHVIEHIAEQHATMGAVRERLSPNGWCVVRTPIVGTEAWRRFGADWVQIDAPRHILIHSERSIRRLGEKHGLRLVRTVFDSTELQFTGSLGYRAGVPLEGQSDLFTRRQRRAYAREARLLNRAGQGDQAAFYFRAS